MKGRLLAALAALALLAAPLAAEDDFGIRYGLDVGFRPVKKLTTGLEWELRTEDDASAFDRMNFTPYAEWKILPWLETKLAFRWILDWKDNEKSWRKDYWRDAWQLRWDVRPSLEVGKFELSYRFRATWRESGWMETPTRWNEKHTKTKGKEPALSEEVALRNAVKAVWKSPFWKLRPYLLSELSTVWDDDEVDDSPRLAKWRNRVGVKRKWLKRFSTELSFTWDREREDGINSNLLFVSIGQSAVF